MTTDLLPVVTDGAEILLPADLQSVTHAMNAYLETTRAVLAATDWQGPPDQAGSFIKKSGWQKIAKAYRLSTEVVSERVERDDDGCPLRAAVVMRAIAPNGQHREATGYCATDEPRFASAGGRQKIEHDLPATAATRAENRAISNLCGLGAVSAEEADGGRGADDGHPNGPGAALPPWAAPGDVGRAAEQLVAIMRAAGGDPDRVTAIGNDLFSACDESIPVCVVRALDLIAAAVIPVPDVEVEVEQ